MKLLLLALLGLPALAPAMVLGAYTCERPQPWEEGAITNVGIAAGLIDGKVLQPGEAFSFNQAMETGLDRFVEGTSYANGLVVSSDGGGICQVSSGLYNAVLLAGLEVLERGTHSLYDPAAAYVPAGHDAMVTRSGHSDFRFRNSTAAPLTIAAHAEGGKLEVRLLGRQRRPRHRWVESQLLQTLPKQLRQVPDPALAPGERRLKRKGFDGLVVKSRLCYADAQGVTHCAGLGTDRYMKVDERWAVGPGTEGKP